MSATSPARPSVVSQALARDRLGVPSVIMFALTAAAPLMVVGALVSSAWGWVGVTGFPAGTPSDWSAAEQRELRTFLSEARETKAKFLLTSRRDEMAWLGELPRRVAVPDMPMQERLQLAGAIVERRGRRLVRA